MKNSAVTLIVVISIALIAVQYAGTLSVCAVFGITPSTEVLSFLKDAGLVALGALSSLLARTGNSEDPLKTEIVNTPSNPVPTVDENTTAS